MAELREPALELTAEAAAQFRAIVTHCADGIVVVDDGGVVRFVNPAAEAILGRSADLVGTHFDVSADVDVSTEMTVVGKEGALVTIELRAAPITWDGGSAVLASIRDVSALRREQRARERSEVRLARVQELARLGHWEWDLDSQQLVWSREIYDIFGLDPETVPTFDRIVEVTHPEDRERSRAFIDWLRAAPPRAELEFRVLLPDGTVRHLHQSAAPRVDDTGRLQSVFGTLQDVTEARRVTAVLHEAQAIAHIGSWEYEVASDQLAWSPEMFRLFGQSPAMEPPGWQAHREMIHPDDWPELDAALARAVTDGTPYELEFRIPLPDRAVRWARTQCVVHRDADGRVRRLSGTVQDISARKTLEAVKRQNETRLEGLVRITHHEAPTERALLDDALGEALTLTGSAIGYLYRYDEGSRQLTLSTWSRDGMKACAVAEPPIVCSLDQAGPWGEAVRQQRAIVINDFDAPNPLERGGSEGWTRLTRLAAVPIRGDDRIVAVVGVANKSTDYETVDAQQLTLLMESVWRMVERRQAARALEEQRAFTERLVDTAQVIILVLDPVGRILQFNRYLEEISDYSLDQVRGKDWFETFLPAGVRSSTRALFQRAISGGRTTGNVDVIVTRNGSERSIEWYDTVLRSDDGEIKGLLSVGQDVTDRVRAEEELRASESRFRLLADNAGVGIGYYDPEGRLLYFNTVAASHMGGEAASFLGKSVAELYDPELASTILARIRQTLAAGSPLTFDDEVALASGGRWFLSTYVRVCDADGVAIGVQITSSDITAQKRSEAAVRVQKRMLEAQGEASIDGILHVDRDGKTLWYNSRFRQMWDMPREVLAAGDREGRTGAAQRKVLEPEPFLTGIKELYRHPDRTSRDELRLLDGRVFDRYSGPVTDDAGAYLGRLWLFRDITTERKLQAAAAQSDRLASMGMLAAGVAHEINNPLSYVLYNLESLAEDFPRYAEQIARTRAALASRLGEAEGRGLAETLEILNPDVWSDLEKRFEDALFGSRRIKEIARGLGTFSRVEQAKPSPIDLRYAIESAVSIAQNELKYRARVVKEFGPTLPVLASEGRLSQVFLNLLVNAAHAIPEGNVERNQIVIRTRQDGDDVVTEIQDTGSGIAPEHLKQLFDPFFTTKDVGVGSGLGLNIANNIVTGYQGTIEVTSEVGKGTCFVVRLPAASQTADASEMPRPCEVSGPAGRVLVIDDEPGIRRALVRILRRHEVVEAESGKQGLDLLTQDQGFDVVLCDMMMPQTSGIDVHRWLVEHHPAVARRLVFVTGGAFTPSARKYLDEVGNLRVDKPFDPVNLQKMVTEWVVAAQIRK